MTERREILKMAARVGARASLEDVVLWELESKQSSSEIDSPGTIRVRTEFEHKIARLEEQFQVQVRYSVYGVLDSEIENTTTDADDGSTTAETDNEIIGITAHWLLVYKLSDLSDVTDEDLARFGDVTAKFSVHPYMRELVQGLTARMGFPPLLLDHVRSPLNEFLALEAAKEAESDS